MLVPRSDDLLTFFSCWKAPLALIDILLNKIRFFLLKKRNIYQNASRRYALKLWKKASPFRNLKSQTSCYFSLLVLLQKPWKLFRIFNFYEAFKFCEKKVLQFAPFHYTLHVETIAVKETAVKLELQCFLFDILCFLIFEQIGTELHWTFHTSAVILIKRSMLWKFRIKVSQCVSIKLIWVQNVNLVLSFIPAWRKLKKILKIKISIY